MTVEHNLKTPPPDPKAVADRRPVWMLPVIVFTQFTGTSLWFAGNAVMGDLERSLGLGGNAVSYMTSSVQFGFVMGTLVFALLMIADRHSPRKVFFACSTLGAVSNLGVYLFATGLAPILVCRFMTGFFLAGIYPVGVKITASWYRQGLSKAISYMLSALVIGTAFPHLLKSLGQALPWETVIFTVSAIALFGGALMLALGRDGPHLRKTGAFDPTCVIKIFQLKQFRAAACGYCGHMWEIYTFWAFVPFALATHMSMRNGVNLDVSFWAFCVMAIGAAGCVIGGWISNRKGSAPVAFVQLLTSGVCCLASPFFFDAPTALFLTFIIVWGVAAVSDSPQFLTLNAQSAPKDLVGSALTIINSIGFLITILSIQLIGYLTSVAPGRLVFLPLAIGPALGLISMWPLLKSSPHPADEKITP